MTSRYDEDLVIWTEEQARALRSAAATGWNAPIDWEHVAEEIESLGISERRSLASRVRTVVEHLMKVVLAISQRIVVLHHGQLVMTGEPNAVLRDRRVIEAYLGTKYATAYAEGRT